MCHFFVAVIGFILVSALSEFSSEKGKFDQAIAPEQPMSSTAPPQPIPTLTISQPATMTPNKNDTAVQKAVSGGEPRHMTTVTKEGEEEVKEVVPVTENKKRDTEHVKMVVSASAIS